MPTDPRAAVQSAALELLRLLSQLPGVPALRVTESRGSTACLIQVWDTSRMMPTAATERPPRSARARGTERRAGCKRDIVELIRDAGRALTRKEIVRGLKDRKKGHGPGTVAKALADLTAAGELVNPKDKKGYRLATWPRRPETRSLFDGV